jgi:hypothetical protein
MRPINRNLILFLSILFLGLLSSSFSMEDTPANRVMGCGSPAAPRAFTDSPELSPPADFIVTANANLQWVINGQVNPTLQLVRGQTYVFDLTAFGDEHPFIINSNANNPFGTAFTSQAYGTNLSFTPSAYSPATIYYHCTVHYGGMAGTIQLSGQQLVCTGDLNADNVVNSTDFGLFVAAFGTTCSGCKADMDSNGTVNSTDFGLFVAAFGTTCA